MCGIAGIVNFKNKSFDKQPIRIMTESLAHRGPDDSGYFVEDKVAFGFRRLSIIDLEMGKQPMEDHSGQVILIYNGEVYNFKELRDELVSQGFQFSTQSDTEVVLNSYLQWGTDCIKRFNGMFAIAIYDKRRRSVFFARDRLGIKPLYYTLIGDTLLFASEIKAILKNPSFCRESNLEAISSYLTFRYPQGNSVF